jgi:hypothetical protein
MAKVDEYDPVTGRVHYRQECQTRQQQVSASLNAKLRAPAPAWVRQTAAEIWVLGRVANEGPNWVLADAEVVDLRPLHR